MFSYLSHTLKSVAVASLLAGSLWASGSHNHEAKEEKGKAKTEVTAVSEKGNQKVCPISKHAIDKKAFVDYQDQRVYLCGPGCSKKFLKKADDRLKGLEMRGEIAENLQKACPVSGDVLEDHDISVTLPGRKVYFCCKDCVKKFKKDPAGVLSKMGPKVKKGEADKKNKNAKQDDSAHKGSSKHSHDHSGHKH